MQKKFHYKFDVVKYKVKHYFKEVQVFDIKIPTNFLFFHNLSIHKNLPK